MTRPARHQITSLTAYTDPDTGAPHRLALHARALRCLSLGLSRAQAMWLRRVHSALRMGGDVLFERGIAYAKPR